MNVACVVAVDTRMLAAHCKHHALGNHPCVEGNPLACALILVASLVQGTARNVVVLDLSSPLVHTEHPTAIAAPQASCEAGAVHDRDNLALTVASTAHHQYLIA